MLWSTSAVSVGLLDEHADLVLNTTILTPTIDSTLSIDPLGMIILMAS